MCYDIKVQTWQAYVVNGCTLMNSNSSREMTSMNIWTKYYKDP